MLYVLQYRPLVAVLAVWTLLCLVAAPLSAQNIRIVPVIGILRPLPFMRMPSAVPLIYPRSDKALNLPVSAVPAIAVWPDARGYAYPNGVIPGANLQRFTEIKKIDEERAVRTAWEETFGFDVWYPYYKEKEIERWVRKQFRIQIFRLRGEVEFTRKGVTYTFKCAF